MSDQGESDQAEVTICPKCGARERVVVLSALGGLWPMSASTHLCETCEGSLQDINRSLPAWVEHETAGQPERPATENTQ